MIHLIVGNTGSGKTTYAQKLQASNNGVLFSIDSWNKTLFLPDKNETDGLEWYLERINRSEKMIQELILQLKASGTPAILDLGLSKYEHREKFRQFAKRHDMTCHLHFLDFSKEIRWERIQKRNIQQGDTYEFEVSRGDFNFMESWFETPSTIELTGATIIR